MSHFYSRIQGTKGPTTRCGDKRNGMCAEVMSWQHNVTTQLYHRGDRDYVTIYIDGRALFDGPLEELASRHALVLSTPQDLLVNGPVAHGANSVAA